MTTKLIYGVGYSSQGGYLRSEGGKSTRVYEIWRGVLRRCYGQKFHKKWPTYVGCTVCPEWFDFQTFAAWYFETHPCDGKYYQLDKDLKVPGNKVYSTDTCLWVSQEVNSFTTDSGAIRGQCLIGVSWKEADGRFQARCRNPFDKKQEHLGNFTDELSAHMAWRTRKSELAGRLAGVQANPEVRDALLRWKGLLDEGLIHPIKSKGF